MELTEHTVDLGIHQPGVPGTGLLKLFESSRYTDVTFLVSGQTPVLAHRAILASQSEYFECLLYGPMKEGRASDITLEETPAEAFRELLKFVYSGSVGSLDVMTTLELMTLADRFGFSYLKDTIEDRLLSLISVHSVLQFHSHAQVSSASRLQEKCEMFIDSNAAAIIASPTLLLLPKKNLKGLISRDSFLVEEIRVFRAVQKWMDYNRVGKEEASELLECVRLTEILPQELEEEVRPSGLYEDGLVVKAIGVRKEAALYDMSPRGKRATHSSGVETTDGNSPVFSRASSTRKSTISLSSSTSHSSLHPQGYSPPTSPGPKDSRKGKHLGLSHLDTVEKMKERASHINTFLYVKIPQTTLCVTYKGENWSYKDLQNQVMTMPTLEYHNKNWTWTDMLMEVKKDYKNAIIHQTLKSAIGMKESEESAGLASPKLLRHASDLLLGPTKNSKAGKGKKLFGKLSSTREDSDSEKESSPRSASPVYQPPFREPDPNLKRTYQRLTKLSQEAQK